jgi:hypothetical protein
LISSDSSRDKVHDSVIRGPDEQIHIRRGAFVGGHVTTDGREGRLDHGIGDEAHGAYVLPAAEAPGERPELDFDLLGELCSLPPQWGWPSAVDEILSPVEQQEARFTRVLTDPLRHVEGGRKPGSPRFLPGQPLEKSGLEGACRS